MSLLPGLYTGPGGPGTRWQGPVEKKGRGVPGAAAMVFREPIKRSRGSRQVTRWPGCETSSAPPSLPPAPARHHSAVSEYPWSTLARQQAHKIAS